MLDILRRIVQEVNLAKNLEQALNVIVTRVKNFMNVEVCSVFLTNELDNEYVLMATDGLNPDAIGKVRLNHDTGLVSLIATRAELINLADAVTNPRYQHFPEASEEGFHGFLGVPIIQHRKVLGVLVIQSTKIQKFSDDDETFLITVAAQLAAAIVHAEASGGISGLQQPNNKSQHEQEAKPIHGLPGAPGVAIGTALVMYPPADIDAIPDRFVDDVENEVKIFNAAVEAVAQDIKKLSERLKSVLPEEDRALFDVYLLMLNSQAMSGVTRDRIREGNWAPGALRDTIQEHEKVFREMEDSYLRERADDVRDLGRRILMHLQEESQNNIEFPENTILVGEDISASMLAEVPTDKLAGVISVRGSRTSHVAILARAMGISAVMGVTDLPVGKVDGRMLIADGYSGRIFISPSDKVINEFKILVEQEESLSDELMALRDLPAQTEDGIKISLLANSGLLSDITPSLQSGAEGIGLYRTEFPFMSRQKFPSEEEQRLIYRQVLESFYPRPVTLRTLDVGGDKALPYFPIVEDNPFLGWRGIRITLDHPEIFLVQIRAMIRASIGLNNLKILLPMISNVTELNEALGFIHQVYGELLEEGEEVVMPEIGVMIEVPSAVYQAGNLARRVDFLSIGTNDLTQYILAVDRNNARVAALYDSLHPAVIRAILQVVESARAHDIPVSVCGEMAGDPVAALLLLAMGIDSLSMSVSSLPRVKWVVRNVTRERARQILGDVLLLEDALSIREYLNETFEKAGMGGLVRAGN
ncbi:MAG: phosphoenolpyruvate--protein phosphotransferase [Gammaproteobacteria bacterium]|nr:phosphoenolpyruvate--protein phosphotransferase [Gammaproteobacteria bacterium]MCW8988127.1 phosphoenolpyruvate--protein phosphotransferase [Gammaproteobacteria bacterium]MCW9030518.1 phosphoenolpyruvate--protein phosphotransferase [Gammaproteobacteria bacterium]